MDHRFVLAVLVLLLGLTQVSLQDKNVTEASLSLEDEDEAEGECFRAKMLFSLKIN